MSLDFITHYSFIIVVIIVLQITHSHLKVKHLVHCHSIQQSCFHVYNSFHTYKDELLKDLHSTLP